MTANPYEFRMNGRTPEHARTSPGDLRISGTPVGGTPGGTVLDEAHRLHHVHPRSSSVPAPFLMTGGWTPAHSAAARFLGECFAAGALLGLVTELTRPLWEQRHG